MKKIIIINGPNLNMLGKREEKIYGDDSFEKIWQGLKLLAEKNGVKLTYFQSNSEGEIIDKIHQCPQEFDLIIMNPGALTHYSYSIHDAIVASKVPTIEVHISNIYNREQWRQKSVISPAAAGIICGFGTGGYKIALLAAIDYLS